MNARTLRRTVGTCAALALTGAAAACGAGGSESDDTITVIASAEHNVTMMGPEAADYLESWETCAPGIEVETSIAEKVPEALASGAADIATTSPNSLIAAMSQGLEATIVGAAMDAWVQFPVVPTDSDADTFADLKGGTFGVSRYGSAGHYATLSAAESLGWSEDDYSIQPMGNLNSLQAALTNSTIDGFLWSGTGSFALEERGDARVLTSVQEEVGPNAMTVWAVDDDLLADRPDDVKAVMQCMYDAVEEVKNDEDLATEMLLSWDYAPGAAANIVDAEMAFASVDGTMDDAMIEGFLDAAHTTVPDTQSLSLDDLRGLIQPWNEL